MPVRASSNAEPRWRSNFWKFWTGQTISTLGSSFTSFAFPLLIFNLTGSSLNLALTVVAIVLPYFLFGLVIGAWVDRVNRKRVMVLTDIALGALMMEGVFTALAAIAHWYWVLLLLWALRGGADVLFTISSYSLTQIVVPNQFLGRVITVTRVLTWSTASLGALLGGLAIERTNNVALVYAMIGVLIFAISFAFFLTPLGHTGRYLIKNGTS